MHPSYLFQLVPEVAHPQSVVGLVHEVHPPVDPRPDLVHLLLHELDSAGLAEHRLQHGVQHRTTFMKGGGGGELHFFFYVGELIFGKPIVAKFSINWIFLIFPTVRRADRGRLREPDVRAERPAAPLPLQRRPWRRREAQAGELQRGLDLVQSVLKERERERETFLLDFPDGTFKTYERNKFGFNHVMRHVV